MRISDLISEDIEQDMTKSLQQMFIPYLAQKKDKVSMDTVISHMREIHGRDWDITPEWVMHTLNGSEFVNQVTPDEVMLNVETPETLDAHHDQQKNHNHVSQMAKKTIKKQDA